MPLQAETLKISSVLSDQHSKTKRYSILNNTIHKSNKSSHVKSWQRIFVRLIDWSLQLYHIVTSLKKTCAATFSPLEKLQKEVTEKCVKDPPNMSLTSWCVAEGVTGGEGDGLLGAGAEWVGEIWDTQRERGWGSWYIPVCWNCSEAPTCILIKGCRGEFKYRLEGGINAWYLLAKAWELETVSTPGELRKSRKNNHNMAFKELNSLKI